MNNIPTAMQFLSPSLEKAKSKELEYQKKRKDKALKSITPKEHVILKSSISQMFCSTSHLIACVDKIMEIQAVVKHYPMFEQLQNEVLMLNSDLYSIGIKDEADDLNRLRFEKKIETIIGSLPEFNINQLDLLFEFVKNLKNK